MTARELAHKVGAKRIGKDKWRVQCPAHHGKDRNLSIMVGKKHPVVLSCMSHGCSVPDIVSAWGLRLRDLMPGGDGPLDPAIRQRMRDEERLKVVNRRQILAEILGWTKVAKRYAAEYKALIFKLYPNRKAPYDLQVRINREGWDAMWKWLDTEEGKKSIKVHIALPHQPPHVHDKCVWDTDLGIIPLGSGGYLFCRQPGCLKLFEVERILV